MEPRPFAVWLFPATIMGCCIRTPGDFVNVGSGAASACLRSTSCASPTRSILGPQTKYNLTFAA